MKIRLDARLRTATVGAQAARRIVCGTQFPAGCLAQSIRTVPSGMLPAIIVSSAVRGCHPHPIARC
jgi:hypothetical protein